MARIERTYTGKENQFLEEGVYGENFIITSVDRILSWARSNSLWPMTFGLACCAAGVEHHCAAIRIKVRELVLPHAP